MARGKFIVIEGQGFSGKTEQAHILVKRLHDQGIKALESQEPGGVKAALAIREELLKRRAEGTITPKQEVELFYQARHHFLEELVKPTLAQGTWVVSTRFSASTYVYQGREGGIAKDFLDRLEQQVVGVMEPNLYILLDVAPEEILRRMSEKNLTREKHGYNEMDPVIIANRQKYYLELAQENRFNNWVIIDGNQTVEKVHEAIWKAIQRVGDSS